MEQITNQTAIEVIKNLNGKTHPENINRAAALMLSEAAHGKEWPTAWIAEQLGVKVGTQAFGIGVSAINEILEHEGFHLTSRGRNGAFYRIESLERSHSVTVSLDKKARKYAQRAAIFPYSVLQKHGSKMSASDKTRLEKRAQTQAVRCVLMARTR